MNRMSGREAYIKVLMNYERGLIDSLDMVKRYVALIEIYNEMLDKTNTLKECE